MLGFTLVTACAGGMVRGNAEHASARDAPWSEEATPVEADPELPGEPAPAVEPDRDPAE